MWRTFVGGTFPFNHNVTELAKEVWQLFVLTFFITKLVSLLWLVDADPDWQARGHEFHYSAPFQYTYVVERANSTIVRIPLCSTTP